MTINGITFDVDFTDAEFIEKIETGCKKVYEEVDEIKKEKNVTVAEGIRQECKILKNFFDYVLGDGTSKKLFGEKDSLNQCVNAFEDIINTKTTQLKEFNEKISKYSPERLQR